MSPPARELTQWLRTFAVNQGRISQDAAKVIRAVVCARGDQVLIRVTDGEWHAAERFPSANAVNAVLPAAQRCLRAVLEARGGKLP